MHIFFFFKQDRTTVLLCRAAFERSRQAKAKRLRATLSREPTEYKGF